MDPDCRSARVSSAILPRRSFRAAAGAACFAAALPTKSLSTPPATSSFPISVMLWTIDSRLPFDQRIAKASEAGYHAVELVDEVRAKLPVLSELECSRLILLTGNRVPGLSNEQLHGNAVNALKRLVDA